MGRRYDTVSMLTDYGLVDEFVGVVKAVIRDIAPHAQTIDLTHQIPPFDVRAGSLALARCISYIPSGVILAVVDPGVGGTRKSIAIEVADGDAVLLTEFFGDPLGVAVALLVELAQQVRINCLSRGTSRPGHLTGLGDNPPHGVATEFKSAGDLPNGHPFLMEKEHRFTLVRTDHRGLGGFC